MPIPEEHRAYIGTADAPEENTLAWHLFEGNNTAQLQASMLRSMAEQEPVTTVTRQELLDFTAHFAGWQLSDVTARGYADLGDTRLRLSPAAPAAPEGLRHPSQFNQRTLVISRSEETGTAMSFVYPAQVHTIYVGTDVNTRIGAGYRHTFSTPEDMEQAALTLLDAARIWAAQLENT